MHPKRRLSHHSHSSRGFTLVELLVVVGILVFVIAMLIPAFSKAQRQARTVSCLSNLHQLFMGYAAYLPQNHQLSPKYDPTYAAFWPNVLRPTFPDVKDILLCPEADTPSYQYGNAHAAWGPFDAERGSASWMSFVGKTSSSYGFNGFLYLIDDAEKNPRTVFGRAAEHVPVFADASWVDGWPVIGDRANIDMPTQARTEESGIVRFELARHGQSTNASFLDGHAEQVPSEQLSELKWSFPVTSRD